MICALPSCNMEVGNKPYKLGTYPGVYCSKDCTNEAFMLKKAGKPFAEDKAEVQESNEEETVKKPATEFGNSGIYRLYCDNPDCRNPVTLEWRGRYGAYCSRKCLDTEKGKPMPDEEVEDQVEETEEDDSPISDGGGKSKTAKKKAGGKKVATKTTKAAPAKKAGKQTPASNGIARSKFAPDATITTTKKMADHGKKGNGATALDLMKSGMTVEKYRDALEKKNLKGMAGWALSYAVDNGLATIK